MQRFVKLTLILRWPAWVRPQVTVHDPETDAAEGVTLYAFGSAFNVAAGKAW